MNTSADDYLIKEKHHLSLTKVPVTIQDGVTPIGHTSSIKHTHKKHIFRN